jgi:sugar O-acyltransferase (sialic acid O-acetyltransferase NeuD family)
VRDLFIIGAGGFARETAEAVRAVNAVDPVWNLLGFLDDDAGRHGDVVGGVPVVGSPDLVHEQLDAEVLICTGRPDNYVSRRQIAERLALAPERYATVIHPAATIGSTCRLGRGSVLLANVDLTAAVQVGRHVAVMPQVVLTHDVRVGDWATLSAGVRVGGGCEIQDGAYVGSGACLRQGVTIGAWAMIGMGALVTRDVPGERLWYGSPARDMDRAPIPGTVARVDPS